MRAIISLHFNASSKHNALGSLALVNHQGRNPNYDSDLLFARGLTKATSKAVQQFISESHSREPMTDKHLHKGVGSNFFYQLARYEALNNVSKCFLEVEFIDRKDVDKALLTKRKQTFVSIAEAIAKYLYEQCQDKE